MASITKHATTATDADTVPGALDAALRAARTPHRGPTFLDVPLDCWGPTGMPVPAPPPAAALAGGDPDAAVLATVAGLVGRAHRPVLMAGGDLYWAGADTELAVFADRDPGPGVRQRPGPGSAPRRP